VTSGTAAAVPQTKAIAAIMNVWRVIAALLYHFVFAVWRAKAGNRIVKATAKEIDCLLLDRQLVANHPCLCWFP